MCKNKQRFLAPYISLGASKSNYVRVEYIYVVSSDITHNDKNNNNNLFFFFCVFFLSDSTD